MSKLKKFFKKLKRNKRYVFLFLFLIIAYLSILYLFKQYDVKQEDIRKLIDPLGIYGIIGLYFIQVIFALTPLPDGMMPIIGTITYGWLGFIVIILGMLTSTIIHYNIAFKLGKNVVEKRYPKIKKYVSLVKGKNVILKLIYIRMFTIISFDLDAYVAGIAEIPFKTFIIASIIGIIPTNGILMLIGLGLFAESTLDYFKLFLLIFLFASILAFLYKKSKMGMNT